MNHCLLKISIEDLVRVVKVKQHLACLLFVDLLINLECIERDEPGNGLLAF